MVKVGINGLGRIGRSIFRVAFQNANFEIAAVNGLDSALTKAHLLQYDSVHGRYQRSVQVTQRGFSVDGKEISVLNFSHPSSIPWKDYGVSLVLECTGVFRKREQAALHLKSGAKKVIISAPSSDADLTVVMGVNHKEYKPQRHHVISNASCTTNCLTPVLAVLDKEFGIEKAHMTTIHSYTADQRLLDLPHKDLRRARAASLNMIPTTTGASKTATLVLPQLKDKVTGLAMRVPTPCASLIDLVAHVRKTATKESVNQALERASETRFKNILGFSNKPLVSSDYIGDPRSSIVDGELTDVVGENLVKVISWYDNEIAFSHRMVELAELVAEGL
ncbi:MAG: type I glyceraldehyde-3-phosphate dehydrogenase [Deltaproteobacteria bacterium]|nr:type I glyceraldehyde-3-phosphate dehydrogenase [Deltaproteobacteria bacterium]